MNLKNVIFKDVYLISERLCLALLEGGFKSLEGETRDKPGVYLIFMSVLNTKDKSLVFNYVYYEPEFLVPLVYYFSFRRLYNSLFMREWGRYFPIFTSKDSVATGDRFQYTKDREIYHILENGLANNVNPFKFINHLVYLTDYDQMSLLVELSFQKDYSIFLKEILYSTEAYKVLNKNVGGVTNNLLEHNLIIVDDLKLFADSIEKRGLQINAGPQKLRGLVNSLNNKLSCLDTDFRNSLYNHHVYHSGLNTAIPRDRFSFKNIHMNLGRVRWFSSGRELNSLKKRQILFQDNYSIVENKLKSHFNVGSEILQRDIEGILLNQENLFSENNISNVKLKFNSASYDLIIQKEAEILQILSNPDLGKIESSVQSNEFIPYFKFFLDNLTPLLVSKLLISYFLKIITNETVTVKEVVLPGIPSLTAYSEFGRILKNRYVYTQYLSWEGFNKGESLSIYKNLNNERFKDFMEDDFDFKVGGCFIFCLSEVKLLYQDIGSIAESQPKTQEFYRVKPDIRQIFIKDDQRVFHLPMRLPMVCEPKSYVKTSKGMKLGGYFFNDEVYTDELVKDKKGYEIKTKLNSDLVINMVNRFSKTPYKINVDTLNFLYKYGYDKSILLDVSAANFQKFLQNPYKGFNKEQTKEYRSLYSKMLLENNILSIAQTFSKVDRLYFPLRLDNRLRVYCDTNYFDYQKNDLAKGLISFARPGIITKWDTEAIKYFKGFGANMFGLDKNSLNYRAEWVDSNVDKILNFENNNFVSKAENKVCFISFCFEFKRFTEFMENKDCVEFYTYLPIQLDATCNGYQHLALLTKEYRLFDKLNLSPSSHDDKPDDFYSYILTRTYAYIKTKISCLQKLDLKEEKKVKLLNSYVKLNSIKFDRTIVKKTIMTKSYNASIPKLVETILLNLEEHKELVKYVCIESNKSVENTKDVSKKVIKPSKKTPLIKNNKELKVPEFVYKKHYTYNNTNIQFNREDIVVFVMCLKEVLDMESPKIKELSKYLNDIVGICTKLSLPIPWVLPSGAEIVESYMVVKKSNVKAFPFIKTKYTFKKYLKETYSLDKQKRATMPNYVHSLDGCSIALLYKSFNKIDLYTIHDCFSVTANNVPFLIKSLKQVYLELYSSNKQLIDFDNLVRINISKMCGSDVFEQTGAYVNLPNSNKPIPFPDVTKLLSQNSNIENLTFSSNIIV